MSKRTKGQSALLAIEKRLLETGMSKGEFQEKSGISSSTMSQWRTGQFNPSSGALNRAAEVLGVPVEYFSMDQNGETEEISVSPSDLLDHTIKYALFGDDARLATDADLQAVYSFARFIISQKKKEDGNDAV